MSHGDGAVHVLRAAGSCLVMDLSGQVPRVLHWGADLGADPSLGAALRLTGVPAILNNSPDVPRAFTVWPVERDGWSGTPAQAGHVDGTRTTPRPRLIGSSVAHEASGGGTIELVLHDVVSQTTGRARYRLDDAGVLAVSLSLVRDDDADGAYIVDALRALLPVPERASELLDFTGKWCRERSPQRGALRAGSHIRRARRGKPGHDAPFLLAVGTEAFGFGRGEVWATHLAWSGDGEYIAEQLTEGAGAARTVLGAAELPAAGEIRLRAGERYDAPDVLFAWSDAGLDGVAARLHRHLRARPQHPRSPRPLTLNSWEAVYFDHDADRLGALVDAAARVGVERFVLDDGWFRGRRSDQAGLGDWVVDEGVWPEGLHPLVDRVRAHGMQFGLWVEPEMVNPDSDLARAHPDWIVGPAEGGRSTSRNQWVLDISVPEAWHQVLERVSDLVAEYDIDYLKWDHNRDLLEAVGRGTGVERPVVHAQTVALYRMLDELRRRHPGLEIETCSGGGGRIDLGILERTDRVWASDCNDPVERVHIERWTRMLLPPELIGSHLGAARSHTTGRVTDLAFRLATALTAHAGIEMDLTRADADELATIAAWSALYRELRPLLHTGRVVNADVADDATLLTGIVAPDGSRALYTWARTATSTAGQSGRVPLPGLDAAASYEVRVRPELGTTRRHEAADPLWLDAAEREPLVVPGAVLTAAGIPLPTLSPQQALLLDVRRVS